jgi:hypothetical protein
VGVRALAHSLAPYGSGFAAILVTSAPLLLTLCGAMWKTPYPISEAVSLLEDVDHREGRLAANRDAIRQAQPLQPDAERGVALVIRIDDDGRDRKARLANRTDQVARVT